MLLWPRGQEPGLRIGSRSLQDVPTSILALSQHCWQAAGPTPHELLLLTRPILASSMSSFEFR